MITTKYTRTLSALFISLTLCSLAPSRMAGQAVTGERLFEWVKGISGKDPEGRREFVRESLTNIGVAFEELAFDTTFERRDEDVHLTGTNIVVSIGKGEPIVIVGAHYDAVPGSPGSNDDGAGVAVLMGLASSFKDRHIPITLRLCFFDQEERGLIGSAVYVREHADTVNHLAMINLDIVGFGSEIFVGPVGGGDDEVVLPAVERSAEALGLAIQQAGIYPSSDHLSFARAGLENIAISVVPEGDTRRVTAMLRNKKVEKGQMPVVLKTMHTPNDNMDTIEAEAMMTAFSLAQRTIGVLSEVKE